MNLTTSEYEIEINRPRVSNDPTDLISNALEYLNKGVSNGRIYSLITREDAISHAKENDARTPTLACGSCTLLIATACCVAVTAGLIFASFVAPTVYTGNLDPDSRIACQAIVGVYGGMFTLALICVGVPLIYRVALGAINSFRSECGEHAGDKHYHDILAKLKENSDETLSPRVLQKAAKHHPYALRQKIDEMSLWQLLLYMKQNGKDASNEMLIQDRQLIECVEEINKKNTLEELKNCYEIITQQQRFKEINAAMFVGLSPEKLMVLQHLINENTQLIDTKEKIYLTEESNSSRKEVDILNLDSVKRDSKVIEECLKRNINTEDEKAEKNILVIPTITTFKSYLNFFTEKYHQIATENVSDLIKLNQCIESKFLTEYIDCRIFQSLMNDKLSYKEIGEIGNAMRKGEEPCFSSIQNYPLAAEFLSNWLVEVNESFPIINLHTFTMLKDMTKALNKPELYRETHGKFKRLAGMTINLPEKQILFEIFNDHRLSEEKAQILEHLKNTPEKIDILPLLSLALDVDNQELLDICSEKIRENKFRNELQFKETWDLSQINNSEKIRQACIECAKSDPSIVSKNWEGIFNQPKDLLSVINQGPQEKVV